MRPPPIILEKSPTAERITFTYIVPESKQLRGQSLSLEVAGHIRGLERKSPAEAGEAPLRRFAGNPSIFFFKIRRKGDTRLCSRSPRKSREAGG